MKTKTIKGHELNDGNIVICDDKYLPVESISEIVGQNKRIVWFEGGTFASLGPNEDVEVAVTTDEF